MAELVTVALYHRDQFSRGNTRRILGYEAYHWAIVIMPQTSQGPDCRAFEATDASEIDPAVLRMHNPTMDWWLRFRTSTDPSFSRKLLGRIIIGHVPDGVSSAEVKDLFASVPLPVKDTHPEQSCVTWIEHAIQKLQDHGWSWKFDIHRFKDLALPYADERMKGVSSSEPPVKYYSVEN